MIKVFLLLLLLSISIEDNNDGVYAQTSNSDSISQEQVLYSNPEYYTLSEVDSTTIQPLQSVGLLFNIKSKLTSDDKTIYITGFEFYTQISGTVFYQLYSRQGEYYDTPDGASGGMGIGDWGKLNPNDLISGGLAEGYGECSKESFENYINNEGTSSSRQSSLFGPSDGIKQSKVIDAHCPLTIIPQDAFPISNEILPLSYPWALRGTNATRSFYMTLASTDLYVAPSKDQTSSFDEVVVASTPHLDLYEGVGSRTYPIDQNVSEYYLDQPVSFIGKIKYYIGVAGEELTEPDLVEQTPQADLTLQPSAAPNTPVPSAKPTRRCRPTRPCPTPDLQTPTISPTISEPTSSTIELIVYLENVPERTMSPREEEEYIEILQDFLQDNNNLIRNGVSTKKVEVFYHNVFEKDMINGKGKGKNNEDEDSFIYHYNTKSTFRPQSFDYPTVYVMTKVDILSDGLPYDVAAFFLWDELTKHEEELVDTFKTSSVFVSYFNDLTNITFEVVEDLTTPPTTAPTISTAPSSVNIEEDKSVERRNIYVFVGVFLGILWCLMTAFSFRTILKHRRTAIDLQHANQVKKKSFSRRDSSSRRISMSASRRMRKLSIWASTPVSQSSRGLGRETSMKSASGLSAVMEMEGASVGSEQVLDAEVQTDNQRVYYENEESGGDDTTTANDSGRTGRTGLSSTTKMSFGGRFLNEDTLL